MAEELTLEKDSFMRDLSIEHLHGLEVIPETYMRAMTGSGNRVSYNRFRLTYMVNTPFQAFREFYRHLPDIAKRGYWTYELKYTKVEKLNVPTATIQAMQDEFRKRDRVANIEKFAETLMNCHQKTWVRINEFFVSRINELFWRYARLTDNLDLDLTIEELRDLEEIWHPSFKSPLADHPDFVETTTDIVAMLIDRYLIQNSLIQKDVVPFVLCQDVDYFHETLSKYDYPRMDEKQRERMVNTIRSEGSVFCIDQHLVATDAIPFDETETLLNPRTLLSPTAQQIFGRTMRQMTARRALFERPSDVVVTRFRTDPSEWLAMTKPIYPMGDVSTMMLAGNNRLVGW